METELSDLFELDGFQSIYQIYSENRHSFNSIEIWAVIKETIQYLSRLKESSVSFQKICITPHTLAFTANGEMHILFSSQIPEKKYLAPEFEAVGNTFKTHLYSLARTLLTIMKVSESPAGANGSLRRYLLAMCAHFPKDRPTAKSILTACDYHLANEHLVQSADYLEDLLSISSTDDSGSQSVQSNTINQHLPHQQDKNNSLQQYLTHSIENEKNNQANVPIISAVYSLATLNAVAGGLICSTAECLALVRGMAWAALHHNLPEDWWMHGLSQHHVNLHLEDNLPEPTVTVSLEEPFKIDNLDCFVVKTEALAPELQQGIFNFDTSVVFNLGRLTFDSLNFEISFNNQTTASSLIDTHLRMQTGGLDEWTIQLLTRMCHDDMNLRPTLRVLVQLCDEHQCHIRLTFAQILGRMVCRQTKLFQSETMTTLYQDQHLRNTTSTTAEPLLTARDFQRKERFSHEIFSQIRQPPQSLRHVTLPKQRNVKELYSNDSTCLSNLRLVTQGAAVTSNLKYESSESSAFEPALKAPQSLDKKLPPAYISNSTHFRPIILHSEFDNYYTAPHYSAASVETVRPTAQRIHSDETTRKLADRLRQLTTEQRRPPANLVTDIEKDVLQADLVNWLPINELNSRPCRRTPPTPLSTVKQQRGSDARIPFHNRSMLMGVDFASPPQKILSHSLTESPRDSGISIQHDSKNYLSPMERLLSNESLLYQQVLTNVIHRIQEEFFFDSFIESDVEDLALAEYIVTLKNSTWIDFCKSIRDAYHNLFWSDDFLFQLFGIVTSSTADHYVINQVALVSRNSSSQQDIANNSHHDAFVLPIVSSTNIESNTVQATVLTCASKPLIIENEAEQQRSSVQNAFGSTSESEVNVAPSFGGSECVVVYYCSSQDWKLPNCASELLDQLGFTADREKLFLQMRKFEQEMSVVLRLRLRALRLINNTNRNADIPFRESKTLAAKVNRDLVEYHTKLVYLEACRRQIEVQLAEFDGLESEAVPSILSIMNGEQIKHVCLHSITANRNIYNELLSYHGTTLHTASIQALVANLYVRGSILNGFVHQFFLGYRYFIFPGELLKLICVLMRSSFKQCPHAQMKCNSCFKSLLNRSILLLTVWLDGYFSTDFANDQSLLNNLRQFVDNELLPNCKDVETTPFLRLLNTASNRISMELIYPWPAATEAELFKASEQWPYPRMLSVEQVFSGSFDSYACISTSQNSLMGPLSCMTHGRTNHLQQNPRLLQEAIYLPRVTRLADRFTLLDYQASVLAAVLAQMSQQYFRTTHPLHFQQAWNKNSRAPALEAFLLYCSRVSHWATAELLTASSSKSRAGACTRLLQVARCSAQLRDFATCAALVEGLNAPQLAWAPGAQPSGKWTAIRKQLDTVRLRLTGEANFLVVSSDHLRQPTIPHPALFLLHVQQSEIGSFLMANGHVKFNKIRSVVMLTDQLRLFRQFQFKIIDYNLEELRQMVTERIEQLSSIDMNNLQTMSVQSSTLGSLNSSGHSAVKGASFLNKLKARFSKD